MLNSQTERKWLWRVLDFINPLRDPSLTVAAVLTFIEEAGQHDAWYWIIVVALVNWVAVRGIVWLLVNFTFASTFLMRRVWWAIRHPHMAWRILDAVGHEEIIIGGLQSLANTMLLPDASGMVSLSPMFGASGIHEIGMLPAGTEIPLLSLPNGQLGTNLAALNGSGMFGFATSGALPGMGPFPGQPMPMGFPQIGPNGVISQQTTDGIQQSFPQRSSAEEERLRQQLTIVSRMLDDWMQFTEEKWRTVSDSQLGWKPLRGRWSNWDDIFQDAYAAKTSDPMAQAAQVAGEANTRRYEASKEKGSAASAVACFMRDIMTLRRGIDLMQSASGNMDGMSDTPNTQPAVQAAQQSQSQQQPPSGNEAFPPRRMFTGGSPQRTLIRRPSPIYVDADRQQ